MVVCRSDPIENISNVRLDDPDRGVDENVKLSLHLLIFVTREMKTTFLKMICFLYYSVYPDQLMHL